MRRPNTQVVAGPNLTGCEKRQQDVTRWEPGTTYFTRLDDKTLHHRRRGDKTRYMWRWRRVGSCVFYLTCLCRAFGFMGLPCVFQKMLCSLLMMGRVGLRATTVGSALRCGQSCHALQVALPRA